MPDVSIIIVNWNTRDLLRNCLKSIRDTITGLTLETIVVDNASQDDSVLMLQQEFPQVILVRNKVNRGFGAANNQGFAIMKGRYALLLNTDTVLTENAVQELFTFMEAHSEAGMAGGQLLNADGSKQNSIAAFPTLLTLLLNMPVLEFLFPRRFPSKRQIYEFPIEIDSAIGACIMVRKKVIDQTGGFDERYFFFFEETDWAFQMKKAGWKNYHIPTAHIYHLQGQSIGRNIRSRIEFYRSRYQFFRKWKSYPFYLFISFVVFLRLLVNCTLASLLCLISLGLSKSGRNKCLTYSSLIFWHLKGLP